MEEPDIITVDLETAGPSVRQVADEQDGPDLLRLLNDLAAHKWKILGAPLLAGALGWGVASILPPTYTATTTLMPPLQNQSTGLAAMLGQLGGLAGAVSVSALKSPSELYVAMLQSRTVADALVQRFGLMQRYDLRYQDDARKALKANSEISVTKTSGIITISASDKDPQVAADMANAYVAELIQLTGRIAVTEASQRRLFFEKQLKDVREKLAEAEVAMKSTQERTGLIQPDEQVKAIIGALAQVRAALAAKEVQINSMRTWSTPQNPDFLRVQEELNTLRAQLSRLEKRQPMDGDFAIPTRNMPAVGVEYVRALRNVKYYETLFELLSKQFELARIEEARESALVQQMDKALKPERKSKPKSAVLALAAALAAGVLASLLALAREAWLRAAQRFDNRPTLRDFLAAANKREKL